MKTMYLADNVSKDGKVYPTVGEHIRNECVSDITTENIVSAIEDNTDVVKITEKLAVSSNSLKTATLALLSGKKANFGGLDTTACTKEELTEITVKLEVSSTQLKNGIRALLTGKEVNFGGNKVAALTPEELAEIKTYLGITTGA